MGVGILVEMIAESECLCIGLQFCKGAAVNDTGSIVVSILGPSHGARAGDIIDPTALQFEHGCLYSKSKDVEFSNF
jgi:hypothetical protein